jgi:hypothetical protein
MPPVLVGPTNGARPARRPSDGWWSASRVAVSTSIPTAEVNKRGGIPTRRLTSYVSSTPRGIAQGGPASPARWPGEWGLVRADGQPLRYCKSVEYRQKPGSDSAGGRCIQNAMFGSSFRANKKNEAQGHMAML